MLSLPNHQKPLFLREPKGFLPENDALGTYGIYLEEFNRLLAGKNFLTSEASHSIMNGGAYDAVRSFIPLNIRRNYGIFFTSAALADKLAAYCGTQISQKSIIIDPACGAGELLLAAARKLPLQKDLATTIKHWGKNLYGFDLHSELVHTTKVRLLILAAIRCKEPILDPGLIAYLKNIKQGNALENLSVISTADIVLMNPPFSQIIAHKDCDWATGKVTYAAVFLDSVLSSLKSNASLYCILPEVIRCGTRYKKLQERIKHISDLTIEESVGIFDAWTDIDVYIAGFSKAKTLKKKPIPVQNTANIKVLDFFDIRVGPVVPYRDPHLGINHFYLDVESLPRWSNGFQTKKKRKYKGTVFNGPFVAIRRTSRPGDQFRAVATVIGKHSAAVAVENHLIVALPKDGKITTCRRLIKVLRNPLTSNFLDEFMRCRHLTVSSIKNIPWVE